MNKLSVRPLVRTMGALLLGIAVAGVPALSYADHGFGGGHGGGGGHVSGGGGHSGGGGGGGGGGGHFAGGGGHFGGYAGGHYGGGFAGGHYGGGGYPGGHYLSHGTAFAGGYAAGGHYYAGARAYGGVHSGPGFASGRFAGGRVFYPGRGYYPGRYWAGGYWGGAFWPRCYFYPGFAWYLPFLPFGYATFWWGGVPYYYVNDLYYTYSPADSGYVVTEPPPATGGDADQAGGAGAYAAPNVPAPEIYLYPRNGQSDQQMSNDRYECHSWAVGQTGFDPTRSGQQSGNRDEYRNAMISCLDARGYSAR